jgi:signal transduction histidine kinase
MGCYGALLSQYLKYELRASREETMRRREHRFLTYMAGEARLYPDRPLELEMEHFNEASPENDLTEILDLNGRRLYPQQDPDLPLPLPGQHCPEPCLSFVSRHTHRTRVLTHQTDVAGHPVWLIMGGSVDEHYDILNAVRGGYFLLLPFVLLGSVAGGFLLSRRALLPVGRMTEAARKLSVTGLDGQLPVPKTGDELQSLAEAWNDLLRRLEAEVNRSTQFTVDASHDLRTAVTVILSNTQLSLRRDRPPAKYREALNTIQQEAVHIITMLEEMLLAARSGGQPARVFKEPLELGEIVTEVYEASCAAATIKELKFQLSRVDAVVILGDRALLRRMISALLDNAVKYTPSGGSVSVSLTGFEEGALLTVQDTGVGIAPAFHNRIFDRLFQIDATRSRTDTSGNGLGLTIAKWIADIHGFSLSVESSVGAGSRFSVLVPDVTIP